MKLSLSPPPYADAPVVVLISGLGGSGSYWLPQLAVLEQEYQVVCYDQRGTGNNPDTLAEDYSIAQMAAELHQALVAAGIERYAVVGHALGALVGMQLALDYPASVTVLISVNGWLRINAHTRRAGMGGSAAVVPLSRRLDGGPRTSPGGRRRAGTGAFSGQK